MLTEPIICLSDLKKRSSCLFYRNERNMYSEIERGLLLNKLLNTVSHEPG